MRNIPLAVLMLIFAMPLHLVAPQVAPYPSCAFYGDSIAAGYHLLAGQHAFPADVATLLAARTPSGNCATVSVDATSGYTAQQELNSLTARGIGSTNASLVVLEFGENEFHNAALTPAQVTTEIATLVAHLTPPTRLRTLVCLDGNANLELWGWDAERCSCRSDSARSPA